MKIVRMIIAPALLIFAACGGCDPDPCENAECPVGLVCSEGNCVDPATLCDPACEGDTICQEGQCVDFEPQCATVREPCDPALPVSSEFYCIDTDGPGPLGPECAEFCGPQATCPDGTLCFVVNSQLDASCTNDTECEADQICDQGGCRDQICRPSECEGYLDGIETCAELHDGQADFQFGAQCIELTNGANFCFPAGEKEAGDACISFISAFDLNDYRDSCATGLACVDNICRTACETSEDCGEDDCLLADQDFVADGVGFCGRSCTPFSDGECPTGSTCLPVDTNNGVCIPAGDKEAFESCVPGAGECEDGTLCVTYEETTGLATCQPICNVSAGPADNNGIVGDFAQTQRDATCPQAPALGSFFRIANFAELGTAIDIYLGDDMTPTFSDVAFDSFSDDDAATAGDQYSEVTPGQYTIKVLPAGAPRSDPALVEVSVSLASEDANTLVVVPVALTPDEANAFLIPGLRNETAPTAGNARIRMMNSLVDSPSIDVIVVPPGDDLTVPANQTELASAVVNNMPTAYGEVAVGMYDLLVFPTGDPRTDRATALVQSANVVFAETEIVTIVARGTIDPDDLPIAGSFLFQYEAPPSVTAGGPRFFCVDIGNDVFGYCQQTCAEDGSGFNNGSCEGAQIGCSPTFLNANNDWRNLCAPVGDIAVGERCNVRRTFGECEEGSYCLEYGNTATGFDDVRRGVCTPHCVVGQPDHPNLQCDPAQACAPIQYNDDFRIGRCGFACTPNRDLADGDCPAGLQSCKPIASLVEDDLGNTPPTVQSEQAFCSSSGDIALDTACGGSDCVPGTECMFPRSPQSEQLSTIFSQYFGAAGLAPVCRAQCDPFDNDSTNAMCTSGETCLFNFPWSSEVGHCTPIVENIAPLAECQRPGEACGDGAICLANGENNVCFQFCQYEGPNNLGQLQASGCTGGSLCNPFVSDVGICLAPM